jgi:phosphopantothenoylcysteine decarboxylase
MDWDNNLNIRLVVTNNAKYFIDIENIDIECYTDTSEWTWKKKGDDVLHINLRNWADIFVIVPLSANTLAKISNGLCDNLLTCIARAWNFEKPMIVFPSMNTQMWNHPVTNKQIKLLKDFGITVINPIEKMLACGEFGVGAIPEIDTIVSIIQSNTFRISNFIK